MLMRSGQDFVVCNTIGVEAASKTGVLGHFQFHLSDFSVNALEELKNEVDQFFLLEAQKVVVRNQEREVERRVHRLLANDFELVSTERHKSFKHVSEELLDLLGLLDADGYSHRVD